MKTNLRERMEVLSDLAEQQSRFTSDLLDDHYPCKYRTLIWNTNEPEFTYISYSCNIVPKTQKISPRICIYCDKREEPDK